MSPLREGWGLGFLKAPGPESFLRLGALSSDARPGLMAACVAGNGVRGKGFQCQAERQASLVGLLTQGVRTHRRPLSVSDHGHGSCHDIQGLLVRLGLEPGMDPLLLIPWRGGHVRRAQALGILASMVLGAPACRLLVWGPVLIRRGPCRRGHHAVERT